jgi:hypothetical protein
MHFPPRLKPGIPTQDQGWICDPLPPSLIHPHSRDRRARPAPAAKERFAEANGAYDQVPALLSDAEA